MRAIFTSALFLNQDTTLVHYFGRMDDVKITFYDRPQRHKTDKPLEVRKSVGPMHATRELRYIERNCFSNVTMNLYVLEEIAGATLQVMCGSLGVNDPAPAWYEWGGTMSSDAPCSTVIEFVERQSGKINAHFWLEDDNENVWDVLDVYLLDVVVPFHRKRIDTSAFVHGHLIPGMSRTELKKRGLEYVPASSLVQEVLCRRQAARVQLQPLR